MQNNHHLFPTVALVEDNRFLSTLLSQELERVGFQVCRSFGARDGFELISRARPALAVLDILFPDGIDGVALFEQIRSQPWGSDLPIVFLTNVSPDERISRAITRHEPAFYFLKSDISACAFAKKIKECFSGS